MTVTKRSRPSKGLRGRSPWRARFSSANRPAAKRSPTGSASSPRFRTSRNNCGRRPRTICRSSRAERLRKSLRIVGAGTGPDGLLRRPEEIDLPIVTRSVSEERANSASPRSRFGLLCFFRSPYASVASWYCWRLARLGPQHPDGGSGQGRSGNHGLTD